MSLVAPPSTVGLAVLETGEEMAMEVGEEADTETVLLRQWLETITPVTRYGYDMISYIGILSLKATRFAIHHTNTTDTDYRNIILEI